MRCLSILASLLLLFCSPLPEALPAQDASLREQATASLRRAADFFRTRVAVQGSYVWRYSEDLRQGHGHHGLGAAAGHAFGGHGLPHGV
jgi:hypothetical protein